MKKIILSIVVVFTATVVSYGQADSVQLSKMNKVQLSDVYLKEVQRVSKKMALTAFDTVANNVPDTKHTRAKFVKVDKRMDAYNKVVIEQYVDLIPYADKAEIIKAIMYLSGL